MEDDYDRVKTYDQMINWDSRLERELPVIVDYFADLGDEATILDVACSSGRHSFGLNAAGLRTIGVDISEHFITLAKDLKTSETDPEMAEFITIDAAGEDLVGELDRYVDGAILLGNAIANMGNFAKGKTLLRNIFILLRPGGKFFVQTVNKPKKPWYNPLREKDGVIIQRIMVPEPQIEKGQEHNVVLHVNQIDPQSLEYVKKSADNLFFMYRQDEFRELVESIGFQINGVYSSYAQEPVEDVDGETLIWKIQKPEITIYPKGIELFSQYSGMDEEEIKRRTLNIWQRLIQEDWYHCIRGYRFLYPRITAHPKYADIVEEKASEPILDMACNTGTDLRQLHVDGARELHGIDISEVFISLGYELFDDRDSCPVDFHVADILDDTALKIEEGEVVGGKLSRFSQYFGAVHAGSLLHLLDEDAISSTITRVFLLLKENGIFFGRTVGSTTAKHHGTGLRYLHSIQSLEQELKQAGFSEVEVIKMPRNGPVGESSTESIIQLGFYGRK